MTTPRPTHVPVLLREVLEGLGVRPGGRYIDGTTGLGGHSTAIAEAMGPTGRLLCIDRDADALALARERLAPFEGRVAFVHAAFSELVDVASRHGFAGADGILLDLGVSSLQLGEAERGFAFGLEGPLDMRMDRRQPLTAAEIVNTWDETDLADLFFRLGEERQARRIAAAVVRARPLATTWDLARAVEQAVGGARRHSKTHPATNVFLALRIRVNGELDHLQAVLPQAHSLLGFGSPPHGGRLAIIAFHSLEDRVVKDYFRRESTDCLCPPRLPVCVCGHRATLRLLTRRAVRPTDSEVAANPRARSAVLRVAERIA